MKKINLLFMAIAVLTSCGVTDVEPKVLEIDGEQAQLNVGYIGDWGTNDDLTYRQYELTFADVADHPSNYLSFDVFSTSTLRLQEGTYYYDNSYESGAITNVITGKNIEYDAGGKAVAGLRLSDWTWDYSGSVTISMEADIYTFEFDLTAEKDDQTHTIKGEFTELLEEGWISTKKK